jgi:hypothetical protein
MDTE